MTRGDGYKTVPAPKFFVYACGGISLMNKMNEMNTKVYIFEISEMNRSKVQNCVMRGDVGE